MNIRKYFWGLRALLYKPFFKKIGHLTYLGKPIMLEGINRIELGNKVRIYPGARMEVYHNGGIIIGDNVTIGQNFHITSSISKLSIGRNTNIVGNVFVTNIDHDYHEIGIPIVNQKHINKETEIGENCFIGYGVAIQAGTKLGDQCIVGAHSVVRGHFPGFCVIAGIPAKIIKVYNENTGLWELMKKDGV